MKIALVSLVKSSYPPIGLMTMVGYLRQHNPDVEVRIVDAAVEDVETTLAQFGPNIVGISAMTTLYPEALKLAEKLHGSCPVVIGGVHITIMPEPLHPNFSAAVYGEGEVAFQEMVCEYIKTGKLVSRKQPIENIDALPCPDFADVSPRYLYPKLYFGRMRRQVPMFSSRGCPYNCQYCSSAKFWGHRLRLHSPRYVTKAIASYIERHGIDHVEFFDDYCLPTKLRAKAFIDEFKAHGVLGVISLSVQTRVDVVDDEMCDLFAQLGVVSAQIGVETGNDTVLARIKKNTTTVEQNMKAVDCLRRHNISTCCNIIVANPGESISEMWDTVRFMEIARKKGAMCGVAIATPFPGTEYWAIAKQRGVVSDDMDFSVLKTDGRPMMLDAEIDPDEFHKVYAHARRLAAQSLFEMYNISTFLAFARHPLYYGVKLLRMIANVFSKRM